MNQRRIKYGLKSQFLLFVSGLVVFISVFLYGFVWSQTPRILKNELSNRAHSLAVNLAYNSEYGLTVGDEEILGRLVEGIRQEPDVVSVSIVDGTGVILAHINPEKVGITESTPNTHPTMIQGSEAVEVSYSETLCTVSAPVLGVPLLTDSSTGEKAVIGWVQIGITLDPLNHQLRKISGLLALMFLLVAATGTILAFLFVRRITTPLNEITAEVVQIADSYTTADTSEIASEEISGARKDEVGVLTQAFHRMAFSLRTHETERQRAEAELQFRNTLLSTQQEATIDGILVVDDERKWISYNQRFIDMWGIPPDVETAKENAVALQSVSDKLIDKESFVARVEYLYEHRDLKSREEVALVDGRTFERYSAPMFGANNRYYGRIWSYRDITERVRAAEQLALANRTLMMRTAALEDANEELSQYAYAVSHDLKAPLRAIHNYVDFLQEDLKETLDGDQKMYLDGLGHAVHQSDELIEDLLELSRLDRSSEEIKPVDMGVFLQEMIASLDLSSEVKVVMGQDWPTIDVDPVLLRQTFQNLINNAIKFNRSPQKRVELGWAPAGEEHYELFVRDNGIGIEPRYFDQIFRMFQRLHGRRDYDGTGIGLALVRKAVSKLRGSVRIESELGEGSTFFVTLPKTQKEN